jgi:cell division protein ZapA
VAEGQVVPVEIHGQRYSIRTTLAPEYVAQLAAYVNGKMRTVSDTAAPTDSLRLAVLAALNIADELFRLQDTAGAKDDELAARAGEMERLLDSVLF